MARITIWILALGLVCGTLTSRAAADASTIAIAMGDLRWGLSESETISFVKRKLDERYNAQIQKTHDAGKQAKLRSDLKRAQADVSRGVTEFTGKSSRWDHSPVAGEFTYGNGESMLAAKDDSSENYYFFLNGRLWKWFKVLDKDAFGHGDFKKFSQSIEGKFGHGRLKKGEVAPGQGEGQWLEYMDRNSRMRAEDGGKRGVFALIFEEMSTVRELASTRPSKPTRLAGKSDDDESEVKSALKTPAPSGDDRQVANASTKRSIFGNEHHEESDSEYMSRKQKASADMHDRQARAHERKEEQKKGEVLKQLDAVNDSDPLGGL